MVVDRREGGLVGGIFLGILGGMLTQGEEKRHLLVVWMAFWKGGIPHCTTARIPLLDRASQHAYLLYYLLFSSLLHEAQLQAMTWPRLFVGRQDGGSIYLIDLCQTVSVSLDPFSCWCSMPNAHSAPAYMPECVTFFITGGGDEAAVIQTRHGRPQSDRNDTAVRPSPPR
jgi:hypothetical protein